jgi:hypothetical protein
MAYDYDGREVWLDDIGGELDTGTRYRLCTGHASRMSPPQGWVMFDLRRPVLELFPSREVA